MDARNHGDSLHTPDHSYPLLAEDLLYFLQEHNIPKAALMGHSMGGRAVMVAALLEVCIIILYMKHFLIQTLTGTLMISVHLMKTSLLEAVYIIF